jgi:ubiquinone/menaquinone biosynthesis C-methylase UbiE
MVDRYSTRLREFGVDPRALGWDRKENQNARFAAAAGAVSFVGRSVLDIGCGLADFGDFLHADTARAPGSYSGIDINSDLIEVCRQRRPTDTFEVRNILSQPYGEEHCDIVTMFGLLNLRFTEFSNEEYARELIAEAFRICGEALIVDMLSAKIDAAYPPEDFVYYYQPMAMLDFALGLTPHVTLLHDYPSIPQREFMLVLRKGACG